MADSEDDDHFSEQEEILDMIDRGEDEDSPDNSGFCDQEESLLATPVYTYKFPQHVSKKVPG